MTNKLASLDIPLSKVVEAIRESNSDVGGRVLEIAGHEQFIRGRGHCRSVSATKPRRVEAANARRDNTERDRRGIFESQQAAGEIGMAIAAQVERERRAESGEPDTTGNEAARAVVDLPAEDVFMEAPGHATRVKKTGGGAIRVAHEQIKGQARAAA